MKIKYNDEVIIKKFDKEIRKYYLFKEFEVIHTEIKKNGVQKPHTHKEILEIFLVLRGTLEVYYSNRTIVLNKGDLIVFFPNETHNVKNIGLDDASFITFKKIYENSDYQKIFKNDKLTK